MITERNIALCIILSIVTCGIYGLYWEICIVNDLNTAADTPNDTSGVMVIVLTIVTCGIYGYYWAYQAGNKVQAAQQKRSLPSDSNSGILYLILMIFGLGIITWCLIQNELNKMATNNA
ncbi:MAG: DUF4234 domain-containing protein [Oscillospiraceae bacterium]|nr:DUF4234 domain-containing protein [Oscillospiraceae bacterium]